MRGAKGHGKGGRVFMQPHRQTNDTRSKADAHTHTHTHLYVPPRAQAPEHGRAQVRVLVVAAQYGHAAERVPFVLACGFVSLWVCGFVGLYGGEGVLGGRLVV